MRADHQEVLDLTIAAMARGFRVADIATFGLVACCADEQAGEVLARHESFDQIPVRSGGRIAGVLERRPVPRVGTVREHAQELHDGLLVAADESLLNLLPLLTKPPHYRLVLKGASIEGMVTRSDALKLPVRLLAFALVTHLEVVMRDYIERQVGAGRDGWCHWLKPARLERLEKEIQKASDHRMDPEPLEFTQFCDKCTIIEALYPLSPADAKEFKAFEKLRNTVSHAGDYASSQNDLAVFVERLRAIELWIRALCGAPS